MDRVPMLVSILIALLMLGCSKIVLEFPDGETKLTYYCSDIKPTAEDLPGQVLLTILHAEITADALKHGRQVIIQPIDAAEKSGDYRRFERLLIEYACRFDVRKSYF